MSAAMLAIGQLTKSAGFAARVAKFVEQKDALIAQNEADIYIADEARVLAEIILMGRLARREKFFSRKTVTAATTDLQFFDAKQTSSTLHETNMPAAASWPRDQVVFIKGIAVVLDPDMTQADKRTVMHDHLLQISMQGKIVLPPTKIRALPAGGGLDGELNNGAPDVANRFELPFFLRVPPVQTIDVLLLRKVATSSATEWAEVEFDAITGTTK